jgi:protein gp37
VDRQENEGRIWQLKDSLAPRKFVSFEPLLENVVCNLIGIHWVIIGGQTNPTKIPEEMWMRNIIRNAKARRIPVFIKENAG